MKCHCTFTKVNLLRNKKNILITEGQNFRPVSVVDILSAATGWTVRCLNPASPWIYLHGNSSPKLGDVVGNTLEKDFGLRLSFMAIFLMVQENKCRFHKNKNC